MPYEDMREFIDVLKQRGELKVCKKEVDRKLEIAKVTDKSTKTGGPAILFENVKGFKTPVITGLFGTLERTALAVDSTVQDTYRKMLKGRENPLPCKIVKTGPCKEVIRTGKDVNLLEIPALWHGEKDSGYFLCTTNGISKDPDTGIRNNGIYRMMVMDRNRLGLWINTMGELRVIIRKYLSRGKPAPVVVAVGADPAVLLCGSCKIPYDMDELEFAGGVRGKPVEMVKCETIDLDVPATSELVIECEVMPGDEDGYVGKGEYVDEGPFPEFTGYYGIQRRSPMVRVKAITHRKDYIYHGMGTANSPSEHQMMIVLNKQADIYALIRQFISERNIRGVHAPLSACGQGVIVSMKKTSPGQAKQVIYSIFAHASMKRVVVVDEDVDPFDPFQVDWAITFRSRAEDYILSPEMAGMSLDPMVTPPSLITKVGIDATVPLDGDKKGRLEVLVDLGVAKFDDLDKVNLADYIGK